MGVNFQNEIQTSLEERADIQKSKYELHQKQLELEEKEKELF